MIVDKIVRCPECGHERVRVSIWGTVVVGNYTWEDNVTAWRADGQTSAWQVDEKDEWAKCMNESCGFEGDFGSFEISSEKREENESVTG